MWIGQDVFPGYIFLVDRFSSDTLVITFNHRSRASGYTGVSSRVYLHAGIVSRIADRPFIRAGHYRLEIIPKFLHIRVWNSSHTDMQGPLVQLPCKVGGDGCSFSGVIYSYSYRNVLRIYFFQAFGRGVRNSGFCGYEIQNLYDSWLDS